MFLDPRTEFHRVVIRVGRDSGVLKAFSTGGQRSSRVASLSGANGFVVLPPSGLTETKVADVGTVLDAIVIGELEVE
jgi:gephyrin